MRIYLDMSKGTGLLEAQAVSLKKPTDGPTLFPRHVVSFPAPFVGTGSSAQKGGTNGCLGRVGSDADQAPVAAGLVASDAAAGTHPTILVLALARWYYCVCCFTIGKIS